jgi:hypothetical protein
MLYMAIDLLTELRRCREVATHERSPLTLFGSCSEIGQSCFESAKTALSGVSG